LLAKSDSLDYVELIKSSEYYDNVNHAKPNFGVNFIATGPTAGTFASAF